MTKLHLALRALALAALAALALVASAVADDGPAPGGTLPPPCAPGQVPSDQSPCLPPPCPAGVQPTPQQPCALRVPGPAPSQPPAGHGDGNGDGHAAPPSQPAFLSRVWRFTADAGGYDPSSNTLNVTVTKILNLPKRFDGQDDGVVDEDADVLFGPQTKVFDASGHRIAAESDYAAALGDAGSVLVAGKFVPPAKWDKDADGLPVPTIRAKRVTITG